MTVSLLAAARTPIVVADGAFAEWHPVDLTAVVLRGLVARAHVDPASIDELWVGCAEPVGAQGADMARAASLAAGWPDSVGGSVIDRAETSGTAALHAASASIASGSTRRVAVVGVSSASVVRPGASALARAYGRPWGDAPAARYDDRGGLLPPARVAELHAARLGVGRAEQDDATRESHRRRRAAASTPAVLEIAARPGEGSTVQRDAPIAGDTLRPLPDDLAALPPTFTDDGTVTAASFACPADGVTALLLGAESTEAPLARLVGVARAAGDPFDATGGVAAAIATALQRAGLARTDVDRWELVEPSAAAYLALVASVGGVSAIVNPDGGALATGDAAAAEELRLAIDAVHRLGPGGILVTVAGGPTGSAVSVWERAS